MKFRIALAFLLLALPTGCATDAAGQLIEDSSPLDKDVLAAITVDHFESGSFVSSNGSRLNYRLLRPAIEAPGERYPLVVQLHGSGGIGTDNIWQVDRLAKSWAMPDVRARYRAYVLVPQFPIRSANYGPATPEQHAVASPSLEDALELVKHFASNHPVDDARIYATGFSMGGSAAWLLPQLAPRTFAAIVPISGIAPPDAHAELFVDLPVLALHGNADTENPITADRRFVEAIRHQGGRKVALREYQGLAHQPPADIYPGFWWRDWLFAQKRK